jgi:ABC-type Fe3+/spermidine/putrescine transport system ATPase subunit
VTAIGDQPVGAAVVVATRPELVHIGGAKGPDDNSREGRIRQVVFQGSRTRVAVDIGENAEFQVEVGGAGELPSMGQGVTLRWPIATSFAYPDPAGAK